MGKIHWNVLVFPGGMENGIEIYNSLRFCKEVTLFSASAPIPNQAFYIYNKNHICPDVRTSGWEEVLNKIVKENNIDVIFPANSVVIDALSRSRDKICCDILLPDAQVIKITRSKKLTIKKLKDIIPTPVVYDNLESITKLPVFIKPDNGYGSVGAKVVNTIEELSAADFENNIVEECLPGKEYTVDCFSDKDGRLLFSAGRERERIRMGTSMHAEDVPEKLAVFFEECARRILSVIKISGAWFFQMKEDENKDLKLLEIDVRIAGTMCYNRCKGVNFPLLSLYNYYGLPISIILNKEKISLDRCLRNRYIFDFEYDNVYIDLDDTIIIEGKYNTEIIKFLFQCINQNKNIILLSKHIGDIESYLRQKKLYDIFSSIIWLKEEEKKYEHIKPFKSIYIDDSFSQRKEVAEKCGIPTFDASMIECLIDDRI